MKPPEDAPAFAAAASEERVASPPGGEYLSSLARGMALLLGAGASCGIAVWELVFSDLMLAYIRSNQIEPTTIH